MIEEIPIEISEVDDGLEQVSNETDLIVEEIPIESTEIIFDNIFFSQDDETVAIIAIDNLTVEETEQLLLQSTIIEEEPLPLAETDLNEFVTEQDLQSYQIKPRIKKTAAENIAQYIIVAEFEGKAKIADAREEFKLLGISLSNVVEGAEFEIQPYGLVTNDSWNLDENLPIYLGYEGKFSSQIEDDFAVFISMGRVLNKQQINLDIGAMINL